MVENKWDLRVEWVGAGERAAAGYSFMLETLYVINLCDVLISLPVGWQRHTLNWEAAPPNHKDQELFFTPAVRQCPKVRHF
jgi:hypothetical protein